MRQTIRETLAFNALDSKHRTFPIGDTEGSPVVVAEIKFREVAVKVLFVAMMVHAAHAALEDAEVAFDRIGAVARM